MTALTPNYKVDISLGNRDAVIGQFTSITDGYTWNTGMSVVEHVDISPNNYGFTYGYTVSGGTITFAVASGPITYPSVLAIGFQ